ncbi:MmyB family transcriptional regulator [Arthrobacter sp. CG_A4]|uniref:MmyB family transcriptional regulator n=1 Tax=Arthrobacter sp. CG_A4 TaxID=3071706 RepID=UPI002E0D4F9E
MDLRPDRATSRRHPAEAPAPAARLRLALDMYANPARPAHHAPVHPVRAPPRLFAANWARAAHGTAAILRTGAGRNPNNRALTGLVGESIRSHEVRTRRAEHNVRQHVTGVKHFHNSITGGLRLLSSPPLVQPDTDGT